MEGRKISKTPRDVPRHLPELCRCKGGQFWWGLQKEFKVSDAENEGSLADTANSALNQIMDKKYAVNLESKGILRDRIWIYGFAFKGKEVWINGRHLVDN